jgi:hypothetical protein
MNDLSELAQGLTKPNKEVYVDKFFEIWSENGFGAFTKKDTETLIFALLDGLLGDSRPRSNYEWAKVLKLTPTKVKNLRLEAHLKYGNILAGREIGELLIKFISEIKQFDLQVSDSQLGLVSGKVNILAENPVIKFELDNILKQFGGMVNFERNQEILIISLVDFIRLVNKITGSGEEKIIEQIIDIKIRDKAQLASITSAIESKSYANKSEGDKLITFLELLGDTFAEKPMKLISHLKTIFKSQKYHK